MVQVTILFYYDSFSLGNDASSSCPHTIPVLLTPRLSLIVEDICLSCIKDSSHRLLLCLALPNI